MYSKRLLGFCIIFTLFSLNFQNSISNCNNIENIIKGFDYNFKLLLELIGTCVLQYFYLFKICYITSLNIILTCVTNYFIVFNNLFMFSLDFIRNNIIDSYIYTLRIIEIISAAPNNYMVFIYFMTKIYINALNNLNN